jgi:CRISPR/Cas system-associated exonuclease Cas4 (RecB family)
MPIALSHSRLSTYQQCPRKFKLQFLDKSFPKEDESPHLVRGSNVHKALENYIIKKASGQESIPASSLQEVERTKPLINNLFETFDVVYPEIQLAVDSDYVKCDWFGSNAYYRAIVDVLAMGEGRALAGDFKTGKIRDYDGWGGQLHLTSAMMMGAFPNIEEVHAVYIYVDHKQNYRETFTKSDLPKLREHFDEQYEIVNADKEFAPKSNEFCKWCPATKAQCHFSRKL